MGSVLLEVCLNCRSYSIILSCTFAAAAASLLSDLSVAALPLGGFLLKHLLMVNLGETSSLCPLGQHLLLRKSKCSYCTYSSVGTRAGKSPLEAFTLV